MKTYWRSGDTDPRILTSELGGSEWLTSRPGHFTHGTFWIGGWVGPRAGLDAISRNLPNWNFIGQLKCLFYFTDMKPGLLQQIYSNLDASEM
jgi:hypothetical protein